MTVLGVDRTLVPWGRRGVAGLIFLALVAALLVSTSSRAAAACTGNAIVCENQLPGTPASEWDIGGAGDEIIQGFATKISGGGVYRYPDGFPSASSNANFWVDVVVII
jgi:hypothetical protein